MWNLKKEKQKFVFKMLVTLTFQSANVKVIRCVSPLHHTIFIMSRHVLLIYIFSRRSFLYCPL